MLRHIIVLFLGLCGASPALAGTWADALFEERSKDFGSVPRGLTLSHPFRLKNNTNSYVHIAGVRPSCGCVEPSILKRDLAPGEESTIIAQVDTLRYKQPVTIHVTFDQPQFDEVLLLIQANPRGDFGLTPDSLSFGRVKSNTSPSTSLTIAFFGSPQARIFDAKSDSNYVQVTVQETSRQATEVDYQLTAKIRPEIPVGKWYTDVWVRTNNPALSRIRVPLTVEIEPALSIAPALLNLGEVMVGTETERKVFVRSGHPFRILEVRGTDAQLSVKENSPQAKAVHVLIITLKGSAPGTWTRRLRVITDLKEDREIEFQAKAQVVP